MKIQSNWQFRVGSELKDYGYTMDGEKFIAESYYIFIETNEGTYNHRSRFHGVKQGSDEEGWVYYEDTREEAVLKAESLLKKIKFKGEIDNSYWEFRPHYSNGGAELLFEEELLGCY